MATTGIGFRWLDLLEKEFDKACVELDTFLSDLENDEPEVAFGGRQKIATLGSCFAQLTHKALSIFQNSAKLEAELVDMRAELVQARAASIEANDGDSVSSISEAIRARAEASQLAKENAALRETILALHSELFGARLATKYLDKELAGRIQQLQLMSRDMRSEIKDSLWAQVEAEILLQRHKTLVRVCRGAGAAGGGTAGAGGGTGGAGGGTTGVGGATPDSRPRNVRLRRPPHLGLGLSVTGGREHGVPILISELEAGGPAALTRDLFVGDAILAINDIDLTQACHKEAVQALQSVKGDCVLCVQFIAADDDERLSEDNYRFPLYPEDGGGATPTAPRTPDLNNHSPASVEESASSCSERGFAPVFPRADYPVDNAPALDMDDDSIKIEARLEMVRSEISAHRSASGSASTASTPVHAARKRHPLDWRTKGAYRAVRGDTHSDIQTADNSPAHVAHTVNNHVAEPPPSPEKPPVLVQIDPPVLQDHKLPTTVANNVAAPNKPVTNGTKQRRENKGFRIGSARRITDTLPQLSLLPNGDSSDRPRLPLLHGDGDPDFGTPV